jgi:hypothetical protein
MGSLFRSRPYWLWFAFLLSAFTVLNVVSIVWKGTRFYGYPYPFALWVTRPEPSHWWFDGGNLLLDVLIGLGGAVFLAFVCTASRRLADRAAGGLPASALSEDTGRQAASGTGQDPSLRTTDS